MSEASTSKREGELVRKEIGEVYDIKDMGKHNSVLGMTIEFDEADGSISLHQKNLIIKTLEQFRMTDCKPKATLLPVRTLMAFDTQPHPIPPSDQEYMKDKDYCTISFKLNVTHHGGPVRVRKTTVGHASWEACSN